MERQDLVLEDVGGAKGIQELREQAAAAKEEAADAKETIGSLAADKVGARGSRGERGRTLCVFLLSVLLLLLASTAPAVLTGR